MMSTQSPFLAAFKGENKTVPVWLMRQAGRYLPQYQAIKKEYSLNDMFRDPKLVCEITCQPVELMGVDAAILFADILSLPQAMGYDIYFDNLKGPIIETQLQEKPQLDLKQMTYLADGIKHIKHRLPESIPLIGFAGSPFTVLSYLVEGRSSVNFAKLFKFMMQETNQYHQQMKTLTEATIAYLQFQQQAGIQVYQLFDSWVGILNEDVYRSMVLPYVKEIFDAIELPSIYYAKNMAHLWRSMQEVNADFLSVCHTKPIDEIDAATLSHGIQGNLYNALLFGNQETIKTETIKILQSAQRFPKYIFNLSHGVLPQTPPENVKYLIEVVHEFKWDQT